MTSKTLLPFPLIQYIVDFMDDIWVLTLISDHKFDFRINKKSSFIASLENHYKLRSRSSYFYCDQIGQETTRYLISGSNHLMAKYEYKYFKTIGISRTINIDDLSETVQYHKPYYYSTFSKKIF